MKALELTVYPPIPPDPSGGAGYTRMAPYFRQAQSWRADRAKEETLSWSKRLTGPELAAELWRSVWAYELSEVDPAEVETLERFATLPHYDQVPR